MVINNFDICCPLARPHKAHAKRVVNANAVLSGTIMFQCLQSITGRHSKIIENTCPIKLLKLSSRHRLDVCKSSYALPFKKVFSLNALEGFDGHWRIVTLCVMNIKRDLGKL